MTPEFNFKIIVWGLGFCISGFFVLAGWVWWVVGKLHEKVPYTWIEDKFEKKITRDMDKIVDTLDDIKDALVGDMKNPGLITKLHDVEKEVIKIKEKVNAG